MSPTDLVRACEANHHLPETGTRKPNDPACTWVCLCRRYTYTPTENT